MRKKRCLSLRFCKRLFEKENKYEKMNLQYKKDRSIVKDYYDMPYPNGIHGVGLYDSVDYMAGLCQRFLDYPDRDLCWHLDVFRGENREEIEHKIMLYDLDDLNEYYKKMLLSLRILKKYYNNDGTLRDDNPFRNIENK